MFSKTWKKITKRDNPSQNEAPQDTAAPQDRAAPQNKATPQDKAAPQKKTCFEKRMTLTIVRSDALEQAVKSPGYTVLACGSIRGGTSIMGYVLHNFGLIHGGLIHPSTYEDLEFERSESDEEREALLQARRNSGKNWALKLPDIATRASFFEQRCDNPILLVVLRNPFAVAKSIIERDDRFGESVSDFAAAFQYGSNYYARFIESLPNLNAPVIFCEFEKIKAVPDVFVSELADTLGLDIDEGKKAEIAQNIVKPDYKLDPNLLAAFQEAKAAG